MPLENSEITFGPFLLDPIQRVLSRGGEPIQIGSRAREILLCLVEKAGEVVSKNELINRVWPRTVVEEGTLRVHITNLRRILGDGRGNIRYVENVTGHGYRFVAPIKRRADSTLTEVQAPALPIIDEEDGVASIEDQLRSVLVVLDKCERVIDAAALLTEKLLGEIPALHRSRAPSDRGIGLTRPKQLLGRGRNVPVTRMDFILPLVSGNPGAWPT